MTVTAPSAAPAAFPANRKWNVWTGRVMAVASVTALFGLSLLIGDAGIGVPDAVVLWQVRLPRTALALLVGAGLGMSGAALQGGLRNRLADPGLLGVTGTASLGAIGVYYWGGGAALPLGGMAGAAVGCVALLVLARGGGTALILAGIAISSLAAAATALALSLAPNPFALADVVHWLLGGVQDRTLGEAALAAGPILLGLAVLAGTGRGLDALSLGEETAASLGVPAASVLRRVAVGTALSVGAGAAVAGGIGFVGLVLPNLLRPVLGERPGGLLLPSALGGAALLLLADAAVKLLPLALPLHQAPPLGALMAVIGAPMLIAVARRR